MHDQALLEVGRIDLPQFLDADAELLRIDAVAQVELGHQLLGERAAHALADQRVLGVQLHAGCVAVLVGAVLGDAHIAGGDALHRAILIVEDLRGGEARIDLDTQRLGLLAEPAADLAQADDVVAVVVHQARQQEVGESVGAALGQEEELIVGDLGFERRALFLPVRNELVEADRIDHGARQNVGAEFRALFEHADGDFVVALCGELLQADRRRQSGRTAAHDHHVVFHRLARHAVLPCNSNFPMDARLSDGNPLI